MAAIMSVLHLGDNAEDAVVVNDEADHHRPRVNAEETGGSSGNVASSNNNNDTVFPAEDGSSPVTATAAAEDDATALARARNH